MPGRQNKKDRQNLSSREKGFWALGYFMWVASG
jgi:hypothetical protein